MLALAVAFLGMFGLLTAAILYFATTVQKQRSLTEATATSDAVTDGSAQFAMADTGVQGCGTVVAGTMRFASGDILSYAAGSGACTASTTTTHGQDCSLCVLNQSNVSVPLNIQKGTWTVPGEVDANGSISAPAL